MERLFGIQKRRSVQWKLQIRQKVNMKVVEQMYPVELTFRSEPITIEYIKKNRTPIGRQIIKHLLFILINQ